MPLVWIDPVRGYMTVWLLNQALLPSPVATDFDRLIAMLITYALLLTALWIQTECRSREKANTQTVSPTAFLAGMIVGLLPPMAAMAALVLGAATAMAVANFNAGYSAASLAALSSVLVFNRNIPMAGFTGFLVAFPMLVSWVRRDRLVMPIRS
jgi:heme A synthase